ncbi:MAG: hypothetical protein L6437_00260 [Kiritimatiellae bacterium]|nr:hypothetical protein [Kiritimatiellia bacterium]
MEAILKNFEQGIKDGLAKTREANTVEPLVGTPGPRPEGDPPNPDYPWWCPACGFWVMGGDVTYEEQHDERNGGCGGYVE